MSLEKPSKSAKEERRERMRRRGNYARKQAAITIFRDNATCIVCWHKLGLDTAYDEVHHFYGRGTDEDDWREHHSSLGCLCKIHHGHFRPIEFKGSRQEEEWVLERANKYPINKKYREIYNGE